MQPSTATRLCDRLVARGLARRQRGGADRRVVWVMLTAAGKDLVGRAMATRRGLIAELVAAAHIHQLEAFTAAANSLTVAAGELPGPLWWQHWQRSTSLDLAAAQPV